MMNNKRAILLLIAAACCLMMMVLISSTSQYVHSAEGGDTPITSTVVIPTEIPMITESLPAPITTTATTTSTSTTSTSTSTTTTECTLENYGATYTECSSPKDMRRVVYFKKTNCTGGAPVPSSQEEFPCSKYNIEESNNDN